ncbi:hypothetical protein PoB_001285600 [Plakobranchus ocellatus]|uniref:Uncharacterized protein n=1 Tax=Plakobranchus ocellatus TaxID=259542 RepID=A0AAV3YVE7_9GAST|nr:hypothetical protein PoB_001285600 [Plakobranchus ocellatus]
MTLSGHNLILIHDIMILSRCRNLEKGNISSIKMVKIGNKFFVIGLVGLYVLTTISKLTAAMHHTTDMQKSATKKVVSSDGPNCKSEAKYMLNLC